MVAVALLVFPGFDLLDVGGPYEVLLTANRLAARDGQDPVFEVVPVSLGPGPVRAYGGLQVIADTTLADLDLVDVLVVPGTIDVGAAVADPLLLEALRGAQASTDVIASVCTGSLLLAHAGLLEGVPATTHHEDVGHLAALIGADAARTARWVDAGDVLTAGGLSSGMAFALHLVERYASRDLAVRTAAQLEYVWDPDDGEMY